jgi:hypothetical protein
MDLEQARRRRAQRLPVCDTDSVNQGIPVLQLSRSSAVARSLGELVVVAAPSRKADLFDRISAATAEASPPLAQRGRKYELT